MGSRVKMSREERAKQFMPFAALKGYQEALREKEKIVVEKIELSDERKEELDRQFVQIRRNQIVTVIYFCEGEYLKITGMVSGFDVNSRVIKIVNTKIRFEDIYEIELNEKGCV